MERREYAIAAGANVSVLSLGSDTGRVEHPDWRAPVYFPTIGCWSDEEAWYVPIESVRMLLDAGAVQRQPERP